MIRIPIHGDALQVTHINLAVEAIRKFFTLEQANTFSVEARFLSTTAVKEKAYDEYRIQFYDNINEHKELAYKTIDDAANAADFRLANVGGATFVTKGIQCDRWVDAGKPADISTGNYGLIRAEQKRLEVIHGQVPTAQQAVTSLRTFQLAWEENSELRERYRGVGKAYVEKATTLDQINIAVSTALDKIATL